MIAAWGCFREAFAKKGDVLWVLLAGLHVRLAKHTSPKTGDFQGFVSWECCQGFGGKVVGELENEF